MVTSRFNSTDLSQLLKKPNACVFLRKCKRHLALTPKALNNINDSVLVHLNRLVRKFDPELDAVVLGSRNVSILTNLGTIVDDSPHIHLDIEAEFYLFKPEKDSVLSGVVNKKSRDNIGCLVHDIFNVSIPIEPDDGIDIDDITLGQTLTFCVEVVDFSHPIPFIKGKLLDSREQSPSKQASGGKKRKRSDQLEASKKIKSEVDSPFSGDDNVNTLIPSIKFPTSILKKTTVFGVESSPARRISFYGDIPKNPTEETSTTEGKTKKKKKKETEMSYLEESPPQQKKKKAVPSFGNEPEMKVSIQDSGRIDIESTGKQKLKKNKSEQAEQNNEFASEPEQDLNILQDFEAHSKKKKNKTVFECNFSQLLEPEEISKEINDHSTSPSKTKKKKKKHEEISVEVSGTCNASNVHEKNKKQVSRNESEPEITGENCQDQEYESPSQKKVKKSKKALNEQENTNYVTDKRELSEEKAQSSPHKRKKTIFEEEGETEITKINVAEIINKTVEDAMKMKRSKKKGTTEVDVQLNESSISLQKKQKPYLKNEIESRKESLKRGKTDSLQTHTSLSEFSDTEEQYPQVSILQAVQLTPVVKKKKSKKMSQEDDEMSDSREHEYLGKKDISAVNPKIKSIINSTAISSSNRLKQNQLRDDDDHSFESLSPIEKSDDDNNEEHSGFITSTQIEGPKTKKVSSAKPFSNNLSEVSVKNSFSDSDSFDVEEFSLSYVPQEQNQNVKHKKGSKDHTTSHIGSRERKPQSSNDSIEALNPTKVSTKPHKHSDTNVNSNCVDVPSLSPFSSNQNKSDLKTVQSKNQKSHLKSSGPDIVSKEVQTDEESVSGMDSKLAVKGKKIHSSRKQTKVQSSTLNSTKQLGNESSNANSSDSDGPTFVQKLDKLPSDAKSANLSYEPLLGSSNVHKKGTRKPKVPDVGPHNIAATSHPSSQKQSAKSPVKKDTFSEMHKSLEMYRNTSHSDLPLSLGTKTILQKQVYPSSKKLDLISSTFDSNLTLSKAPKPTSQKQIPVSHKKQDLGSSSSGTDLPLQKHLLLSKEQKTQKQTPVSHKNRHSDSRSSDVDLPLSKAAKPTTQKNASVSQKKRNSDSSSSDSDLPSQKELPLSKAVKTTKHKQVSVSDKIHDSDRSSSDSDLPSQKQLLLSKTKKTQKQTPVSHKNHHSDSRSSDVDLPLSQAAKKTMQKKVSVSQKKSNSDSSSSDLDLPSRKDLPLSKAVKTTQNQISVSDKKHDSDRSSSESDLPLSMDLPLSIAAKLNVQKHFPNSHKNHDLDSRHSVVSLPLSKTSKTTTQKKVFVSQKKRNSDSSSSDSDLPSHKDLPLSKAVKTTTHKQVSVSNKKHDSDRSSSDSDLPLSMDLPLSIAAKLNVQKQFPNSHKNHDSDSRPSDVRLPLSKAAKTTQVRVSHKKHDSDSSSSDSDLPLSMDLPLSKAAKLTAHKLKKHDADNSSSDLDIPLSKVAKTTTQKVPVSHEKRVPNSSSSDSDLPSHKGLPISKAVKAKQKQVSVSHNKHDSDSSSSDSDLPLPKNLPLSKAIRTTEKQVPVLHNKQDSNSSSSDSDLPLSMDLPLSKAVKMATQKQSSDSNKNSGSHRNNAISDLSSSLKTKIPSVEKEEPLSPHKSFRSKGKTRSGRGMISQGDSIIPNPKTKDTNESKHTKQQTESNEKKQSGSETNSIVEGLLAEAKKGMLNSLEFESSSSKNTKSGKTESKKASRENNGAYSQTQTSERKGKKTNISKETVEISKHSKKFNVNSRKKHDSNATSTGVANLADELLKKFMKNLNNRKHEITET